MKNVLSNAEPLFEVHEPVLETIMTNTPTLNEGMEEGSRLFCLRNNYTSHVPHNYNKSSSTILSLNSDFNDFKINHCLKAIRMSTEE